MIDFSTLQGLSIPEGVVTQIADASGRVLWVIPSGGNIVLEVEKITSDTHSAEGTFTAEEFILLDIYPKTNGTVSVTYGGLTKTFTDTSGADKPNAHQIFFGTFNGVSDNVTTPSSGELIIEGDCYAFGGSSFVVSSKSNSNALCVKKILNFGEVEEIQENAFVNIMATGNGLVGELIIPLTIKKIGESAFLYNDDITNILIKPTNISVGAHAFTHTSSASAWQVTMLSNTPPEIDSSFGLVGDDRYLLPERIIVPKGCVDVYKVADGWNVYADLIVEAS